MLFTNPEILMSSNDMKIGKVESENEDITYLNYMLAIEFRILKLVIDFVKADMADGATKEDAIKDCTRLVYSTLHIDEKTYPDDEEGIVKEIIERSEEFNNWSTEIKYRFLNTHKGVVKINTPITITGTLHPNIDEGTMEQLKEDDTLQVFLDGLASVI